MAIDTSLFAADLPAGTYAVGDRVQLGCVSGPAVVRSGRGAAILKRITSFTLLSISGSLTLWKVHVRNGDWIDDAISLTTTLKNVTSLDRRTGCIQSGNDCNLTPNSSWEVWAECYSGGTTTKNNSIACLIDVDYPQVASIIDPDALKGIPTSLEYEKASVPVNAAGTLTSSNWAVENVDIFKAGYQYALCKMEFTTAPPQAAVGFIALANAAGQGGLVRIVPMTVYADAIRAPIEYATPLVKGPMDIKIMMFDDNTGAAGTTTANVVLDFVKRRLA